MTEAQILAAAQEILMSARISNLIGTEAEWTAANPTLKRGEIGFISGANPLKWKVGDGTTPWATLGWAQVDRLAQLLDDTTHRVVTDSQISNWNAKPNTADVIAPSQVVNNLTSTSAIYPLSAAQGKVLAERINSKQGAVYSIIKTTSEAGSASTYRLTEDGVNVGAPINIPLDQVLKQATIETVTTAGSPYAGAKVGDKYIKFIFQNSSTPQYLPVQDLVDIYTGDNVYIEVTAGNKIALKYGALKTALQTDFNAVYDAKGAGYQAATDAVNALTAKTMILKCTIQGLS